MAAAAAFLRLILRSRFWLCSFRLIFCLFLLRAIGFSFGRRMLTELMVFPPAQPAREVLAAPGRSISPIKTARSGGRRTGLDGIDDVQE